jgi:hypothetical protein
LHINMLVDMGSTTLSRVGRLMRNMETKEHMNSGQRRSLIFTLLREWILLRLRRAIRSRISCPCWNRWSCVALLLVSRRNLAP